MVVPAGSSASSRPLSFVENTNAHAFVPRQSCDFFEDRATCTHHSFRANTEPSNIVCWRLKCFCRRPCALSVLPGIKPILFSKNLRSAPHAKYSYSSIIVGAMDRIKNRPAPPDRLICLYYSRSRPRAGVKRISARMHLTARSPAGVCFSRLGAPSKSSRGSRDTCGSLPCFPRE